MVLTSILLGIAFGAWAVSLGDPARPRSVGWRTPKPPPRTTPTVEQIDTWNAEVERLSPDERVRERLFWERYDADCRRRALLTLERLP